MTLGERKETPDQQLQLPAERPKGFCYLLLDGKEFARIPIFPPGNHD